VVAGIINVVGLNDDMSVLIEEIRAVAVRNNPAMQKIQPLPLGALAWSWPSFVTPLIRHSGKNPTGFSGIQFGLIFSKSLIS